MIVALWVAVVVLIAWDILRTRAVRRSFAKVEAQLLAYIAERKNEDAARTQATDGVWLAINTMTDGRTRDRGRFSALCSHLGVEVSHEERTVKKPMTFDSTRTERVWVVKPVGEVPK